MEKRKKLGIIGGMGSRAGALFLNKVIDYSPAVKDQEFLEIIFHNNAAIPDRTKAVIYNGESPLRAVYNSLDIFNQNNVDAIAMTCMTVHYYYNEIAAYANARVFNPLRMIADEIGQVYPGVRRVGILAGTGAINSGMYHKALADCDVELVTLSPEDQEAIFMRAVFMENGFKSAVISPEARGLMEESVKKLKRLQVDLIIGGCTEVSIGVDEQKAGIPYLDALDLLARKAVNYCYGREYEVQPA
jgi:aspartate racemase